MRYVGRDIYIQRGETFTLDFEVVNAKGDPLMLFKKWPNPYLVITVSNSLYEQEGDMCKVYWLDLSKIYVQDAQGNLEEKPFKSFIVTEPLYLPNFNVPDALHLYESKIVTDVNSEFDICNFLFTNEQDGIKKYKYVKSYTGTAGAITDEVWEDYKFRILKCFDTNDWTEQTYICDMKIVCGDTLKDYVANCLKREGKEFSGTVSQSEIDKIEDAESKVAAQSVFDSGAPLTSTRYTVCPIDTLKIIVGANARGGN